MFFWIHFFFHVTNKKNYGVRIIFNQKNKSCFILYAGFTVCKGRRIFGIAVLNKENNLGDMVYCGQEEVSDCKVDDEIPCENVRMRTMRIIPFPELNAGWFLI